MISQPTSPITYFPNPSSFTHSNPNSLPTRSPSISNIPLATSRPPSILASSTEDEDEFASGERTPRNHTALRPLESGEDSPKTRRSSTMGSTSDVRRVSTAVPVSKSSGAVSRTLPTPIQGYGATHTSPALSGIGLGHPDGPPRQVTGPSDNALSSPRRISTSQAPPTSHSHRSPASLLNLPSHEAYYTHSQPPSSSTPRFRDDTMISQEQGASNGRRHHGHIHSLSAQIPNQSLTASGSLGLSDHRRAISVSTAFNSPVSTAVPPRSPGGSVFHRMRKTASAVGLAVGRPESYDGDVAGDEDDDDEDEDEEEDEGMKANGTRVWYRWVVKRVCVLFIDVTQLIRHH